MAYLKEEGNHFQIKDTSIASLKKFIEENPGMNEKHRWILLIVDKEEYDFFHKSYDEFTSKCESYTIKLKEVPNKNQKEWVTINGVSFIIIEKDE